MRLIALMFHDIYNVHPDESGFEGVLPASFKIEKSRFIKIIELLIPYITNREENKTTNFPSYQLRNGHRICFTFDDGGESNYDSANILAKYNLKGCFFISTKFLDTPGFLTKDQLKSMSEQGHLIGSHSHSHPQRISALSAIEIEKEWKKSKDILESCLKKTINVVSIPGGYFSPLVRKALYSQGIQTIFTSTPFPSKYFVNNCEYGRLAIERGFRVESTSRVIDPYSIINLRAVSKRFVLGVFKKILGQKYFSLRKLLKQK